MKRMIAAAVGVAVLAVAGSHAGASVSPGCNTRTCAKRVCTSRACKARTAPKATAASAVSSADRAWLNQVGACESDSYGGYNLTTTGNGFWFRYQFTPSTWASVGGHLAGGVPVGVNGESLPSPWEQDMRALRVRASQGRGAWPRCG